MKVDIGDEELDKEDCQNKTKVGLKANNHINTRANTRRQNKTKVGLKDREY